MKTNLKYFLFATFIFCILSIHFLNLELHWNTKRSDPLEPFVWLSTFGEARIVFWFDDKIPFFELWFNFD